MARPGVISRTSAVLASSHAVAAGSIASNSGSLRIGEEHMRTFRWSYRKLTGRRRRRVATCGTQIAATRVITGHSAALPRRFSAGLDEVLVRARWGGAALALVLGARLRAAVGML